MKNLRLNTLQWHSTCLFLLRKSLIVSCQLTVLLSVQGCMQKSVWLDQNAEALGFAVETLRSDQFQHRIYKHNQKGNAKRLHVYLDGDGQPWIAGKLVSNDPTPENPLILELMALDSSPAIYLGRPCYHGFSSDPLCDSALWTSHRYSSQVVNSLYLAVRVYLEREGFDEVVLIGFSGGGSLAMLLAEQLKEARVVVTVAGNLDIDGWTRHHRYTPLGGSLNPARQAALNPEISQYHLVGKKDENIPFHLVQEAIRLQPGASLLMFEGFDHACCWATIWPALLKCLNGETVAEHHSGCTSSRLISSSP